MECLLEGLSLNLLQARQGEPLRLLVCPANHVKFSDLPGLAHETFEAIVFTDCQPPVSLPNKAADDDQGLIEVGVGDVRADVAKNKFIQRTCIFALGEFLLENRMVIARLFCLVEAVKRVDQFLEKALLCVPRQRGILDSFFEMIKEWLGETKLGLCQVNVVITLWFEEQIFLCEKDS